MNYKGILNQLKCELEPFGFESHPFKVGWYNSHVDEKFKLDYDENTFAVLIINAPSMFEKLFLPFLFEKYKNHPEDLESLNDPIDDCMNFTFDHVKNRLEESLLKASGIEIETMKDYEMVPGLRRPKVIMQTCAHICGAAYYYDPKKIRKNINIDETNQFLNKNLMGVCLHSKYGGWFAMRCVFVFKNLVLSDEQLENKEPIDALNGNIEKIIDLLKKFNYNWKDSSYRDVINVCEKYSDIQKEYFLVEPKFRKDLLKQWLIYANLEKLCESYNQKMNEIYLTKNFYYL